MDTGLTRGERLVVLLGQKKAIAIAVRNVSGRRRWSKLDVCFGSARPAPHSVRRRRAAAGPRSDSQHPTCSWEKRRPR
jgi:exodeoxyribonuclease V alpha subunit